MVRDVVPRSKTLMGRHHHHNGHHREPSENRNRLKLTLSLLVTLLVMGIEVVGGVLSKSIALISDAGHMFTHVFALGIALVAAVAASQPACHHRTFGLVRAEILAAFVNSLVLLAAALYIIYESILRFVHPENILSTYMLAVAVLGLLANLVSIWILHGSDRRDMNVRGVILHMLADAVSSVAIVAGAGIIAFTGWVFIDPVISIGIAGLIIAWGWNLLLESSRILLQTAPPGINSETVERDIIEHFPEVQRIESARLWSLTGDTSVYTAHLTLKVDSGLDATLLDRIASRLEKKFNVIETTLQVKR
jgi:cobalt-zinc-cadmium efflux system protein